MTRNRTAVGSLLALLLVLAAGPRATAEPGALTEVPAFGSNPGELQMFEYVPEGLPAGAPLVVVMHGCFGQAAAYDDETGWTQLADERKWALVFPQQAVTNNDNLCFSWVSEEDTVRHGGEAASIVEMVRWMQAERGTDPTRVFATGHSAGGYFTSVLLATYPDVFRAGASVSGGPYRCKTYQEGSVAPGVPVESTANEFIARRDCTQAVDMDRTPQQWGDLARAGHPAYRGPKPRVSLWHGTKDDVVVPANLTEALEQWTDYHGIDMQADRTDLVDGYPHEVFTDGRGVPLVETYRLTDRGHSYPGDGSPACPGQENVGICPARHMAAWFEAAASPTGGGPRAGVSSREPGEPRPQELPATGGSAAPTFAAVLLLASGVFIARLVLHHHHLGAQG